jgi:hypothetical protein
MLSFRGAARASFGLDPLGLKAMILVCAGCTATPGPYAPAPGFALVLELGNSYGVAWSPLWCRAPVGGIQSCARLFPDSSQAVLQWDVWHRPFQFTRGWNGILPIRAFDLRDSLRRDLVRRGARRVDSTPQLPYDSVRRTHMDETKWCLDSAVVLVAHSWQEGSSFESVNLLVGAIPDRDCSTEVFGAYRPRQRMRPTVLQF